MEIQQQALIVDDNADNREIFRTVLDAIGYATQEANNGKVALDKLQQDQFALMLLDMQMPLVDGRTVLREVRSDPQFDSMTIVVVTANPQISSVIEDLASYVLYKPIELATLATLLQRIKRSSNLSA